MTHILPLRATALGKNRIRLPALLSRLPVALGCFVAAVVFASVAAASTPLMSWMDVEAEGAVSIPVATAVENAMASPVVPQGDVRSGRRPVCDSCGVVESVLRLEQAAGMPAAYEMTVRLRDGTSRISSIANNAQWRAGDRIMLIGSTKPTVQ